MAFHIHNSEVKINSVMFYYLDQGSPRKYSNQVDETVACHGQNIRCYQEQKNSIKVRTQMHFSLET